MEKPLPKFKKGDLVRTTRFPGGTVGTIVDMSWTNSAHTVEYPHYSYVISEPNSVRTARWSECYLVYVSKLGEVLS